MMLNLYQTAAGGGDAVVYFHFIFSQLLRVGRDGAIPLPFRLIKLCKKSLLVVKQFFQDFAMVCLV